MKYKSCNLIQHGLCFFNGKLVSCCFAPCDQINGQTPPVIYDNYNGEIPEKEDLFNRIEKYSSIFKNGGCPKECLNCYHIEEKEWDEEKYINSITITHFSNCNADCIYCSNNLEQDERTNKVYEILPILDSLKEKGIIKQGCEFHIGGGEFTIYKECNELLEKYALTNFAKIAIPTNAIIYNENLFKALDNNSTAIIVSLDSGCKKTYKKIKKVDAFDKVVENLTKYAKNKFMPHTIGLKYIIIPTYNDNLAEYKKFIKIAKKAGIQKVIIDIDARYARLVNFEIDTYLINLVKTFENIAIRENFITETYSFFKQSEETTKSKKSNILTKIKNYIKYKFFNKKIKELYLNNHYGK